MDDTKLIDSYINLAKAKSGKLETDVVLVISALVLIWISMEAMLPQVQTEVFQYNGYESQANNISARLRYNRLELDNVRAKEDTVESKQTKSDLFKKEENIRERLRILTAMRADINKKVAVSDSKIEFKLPLIGQIQAPYYLSTVIWSGLAIIFITYLFKTREIIIFYYYNALILLQKNKNNRINRNLGFTFPQWCLPLRNGNEHLPLSTIASCFGKSSIRSIDNFLYPAMVFGLMSLMAVRTIYLSYWILTDLQFIWWYWSIVATNVFTLGLILYLGTNWFLHHPVELMTPETSNLLEETC